MASKTDVWMPLYIADYLADTSRLTTLNHGAYMLLIMDYWRNGALPDDDFVLAQVTRMGADAWSIARVVLVRFFSIENGAWIHKRIEEEIKKAGVNSQKAHDRAVKAAAARWDKENTPSIPPSISEAKLEDMHKVCPSPSPSPSPSPTESTASTPTPKIKPVSGAEKSAPTQKTEIVESAKPETDLQAACRETWKSYSDAYFSRYETEPVRNATVNTQVKSFVKRIGVDESPPVAAFFVQSNSQFYVQRGHTFGNLLADAEKLRTEWATGRTMTGTRARQIDATQANYSVVGEAMKILEAQHAANS